MKITRLLAITIITIATACSQDEAQRLDPTLEHFQTHLKIDMAYDAIVANSDPHLKTSAVGFTFMFILFPIPPRYGLVIVIGCCMPGRLTRKVRSF